MASCPVCNESLPDVAIQSVATQGIGETVEGVRCQRCGLMIFHADSDVEETFTVSGARTAGTMIAHFRLVRPLGGGGFGEVWLADDTALGRKVALKLPAAGRFEGNLLYEAKAAAKLNHPNIVSVYEAGVAGGQEFIATEFVDGQTLQDLLSSQSMTEEEVVRFLQVVCEALGHAHTNRIVHRDVKPGNILVDAHQNPLVTDFGLAKHIAGRETLSSDGQVLGTALYMAPEQAEGKTKETDHRADIYAVGVMLFEMLTGYVPFRGTVQAVLRQKVERDAPSPRTLKPRLSRDVETVCLRCLEREPAKRYQTTFELIDEFRRMLRGEPIKARPITSLERGWRWCKRRPLISGLALALVLSLTGGLVGVSYFYVRADENAARALASLYRAKLNLIGIAHHSGDITAAREGLDSISSVPGLASLRDFGWDYFDAQTSMLTTVGSHGGAVGDLAISNNGRYVASVGDERGPRDLRIWDVENTRLLWRLVPETGRALVADFSPARSHIAVGTSDGWVRVYQSAIEGPPIIEFKHGPAVRFLLYSQDGRYLISCSHLGAARVWDLESQERVNQIPTGTQGTTLDVRLSPDGSTVGILKDDGFLRIRDLLGLNKIADVRTDGEVRCFTFVGDGSEVATAELSEQPITQVYSVPEGTPVRRYEHGSQIGDYARVPKSSVLLVTELDGYVVALSRSYRRAVQQTETHNLSFGNVVVSANGRIAAIVGREGAIRVGNVSSLTRQEIFPHDSAVQSVCYLTPNDDVATSTTTGEVRRWNTRTGESTVLRNASFTKRSQIEFDPVHERLAFGAMSDKIDILDARSGEQLTQLDLDSKGVAQMQFLRNGDLVCATRSGKVLRYTLGESLKAGHTELIRARDSESSAMTIEVSEATGILYLGDSEGMVTSYRLSDGAKLVEMQVDSSAIGAICAVDPTGQIAVGSDAGLIALLDGTTLAPFWKVKGHVGEVNTLGLLESDSILVTASRDSLIKLWDVGTGEAISTLSGHFRQVFDIAIRNDEKQILSASLEGDARLWTAQYPR